jgi:hypothetical protein
LTLRILNIILATLVFISSTGFVINKHYCQGELKETAFMVKAKSCHETAAEHEDEDAHSKMPANCPMHSSKKKSPCEERKDCCKDKSEFIKLDIDQEITSFEIQKIQAPVLASILLFAYNVDFLDQESSPVHYKNYKPPLLVCDYFVSLQTFLL